MLEMITQEAVLVTNQMGLIMSSWTSVTWDQDPPLRPRLKVTTGITEVNSKLLGDAEVNCKLSSYFTTSSAFTICDPASFTDGLYHQGSHSSSTCHATVLGSALLHYHGEPSLYYSICQEPSESLATVQ